MIPTISFIPIQISPMEYTRTQFHFHKILFNQKMQIYCHYIYFSVLEMELGALCKLSKYFTTELHAQAPLPSLNSLGRLTG